MRSATPLLPVSCRLSEAHKELLPSVPAKIAAARHCAYQNQLFFNQLEAAFTPDDAPEPLCHAAAAADEYAAAHGPRVSPQDAEKVRYIIKNVTRDWTAEGRCEREQSYGRLLTELQRVLAPQLTAASASPPTGEASFNRW